MKLNISATGTLCGVVGRGVSVASPNDRRGKWYGWLPRATSIPQGYGLPKLRTPICNQLQAQEHNCDSDITTAHTLLQYSALQKTLIEMIPPT